VVLQVPDQSPQTVAHKEALFWLHVGDWENDADHPPPVLERRRVTDVCLDSPNCDVLFAFRADSTWRANPPWQCLLRTVRLTAMFFTEAAEELFDTDAAGWSVTCKLSEGMSLDTVLKVLAEWGEPDETQRFFPTVTAMSEAPPPFGLYMTADAGQDAPGGDVFWHLGLHRKPDTDPPKRYLETNERLGGLAKFQERLFEYLPPKEMKMEITAKFLVLHPERLRVPRRRNLPKSWKGRVSIRSEDLILKPALPSFLQSIKLTLDSKWPDLEANGTLQILCGPDMFEEMANKAWKEVCGILKPQ
jgi:hypothetical protein